MTTASDEIAGTAIAAMSVIEKTNSMTTLPLLECIERSLNVCNITQQQLVIAVPRFEVLVVRSTSIQVETLLLRYGLNFL
jgi:hypothetical protein